MKILHLTLYKKWFNEIASGVKKEEYRDVKPYWTKRIVGRDYDEIHFRNGYAKDAPLIKVEYNGWRITHFNGKQVYGLALGKVLEITNQLKLSEVHREK
jgi:hypothetical protein